MAVAVLCPGQGAQSPGFLDPWIQVPQFADELQRLSTRAYVDLKHLGTDPDADVVDTAVAQPLIVASGIATARLLGPLPAGSVVVGHSVGELTAAAVAGMLSPAAAVDLARERGRAMAAAAATAASGMVAILGGDAAQVEAAIISAGCWIANHNGSGQVVAGGSAAALDALVAAPPPGARLRRLAVAGAFHTPLMEPAGPAFATAADATATSPAAHPVVANGDGQRVYDGAELLRRLVVQLTAPVRFDLCLSALEALGVDAVIELAPAGVLTGLVRRALRGVEAVAVRTPDDLDAAHRVLAEHATVGEAWTEPWRVLVAPATGTLECSAAVVRNRSGDVPLQQPSSGTLEWLAHDGDPVSEGQPVARLVPAAS
jgi:[acyl-carrier-protein] S-malonyltransferase